MSACKSKCRWVTQIASLVQPCSRQLMRRNPARLTAPTALCLKAEPLMNNQAARSHDQCCVSCLEACKAWKLGAADANAGVSMSAFTCLTPFLMVHFREELGRAWMRRCKGITCYKRPVSFTEFAKCCTPLRSLGAKTGYRVLRCMVNSLCRLPMPASHLGDQMEHAQSR